MKQSTMKIDNLLCKWDDAQNDLMEKHFDFLGRESKGSNKVLIAPKRGRKLSEVTIEGMRFYKLEYRNEVFLFEVFGECIRPALKQNPIETEVAIG